MLTLLGWIVSGVELIGSYVLWALETFANAIFGVIAAAAAALFALLPSMSDAPLAGGGDWLGWLNWFFPVGDLLAILATVVALWVSFLIIRWALRVVRAI